MFTEVKKIIIENKFITMKKSVEEEVRYLIKELDLNCSVEEFKNKVDWWDISEYQKLSEGFIREFKDKVIWINISAYQKLSEGFIREFKDKVIWINISASQKLSENFIQEFKLKIDPDNWLYKDKGFKLKKIKETGLYEFIDSDHILAYKGIRSDRYSQYNFQYRYLTGETYECHCDCTDDENSFGLSAWTEEKAKEHCGELVIKVKINVADIGRIVHDGGKLRCFKFTVID
jgi:hypothetical protein